jgi:hypothetical protein
MLDPQIRNWVVVPMVLIMVCVGMLRNNVMVLMKTEPDSDVSSVQQIQTLQRSQRTRSNRNFLMASTFEGRKKYFTDPERGILKTKGMKVSDSVTRLSRVFLRSQHTSSAAFLLPFSHWLVNIRRHSPFYIAPPHVTGPRRPTPPPPIRPRLPPTR